jgi:hypothetical protein
LDKLEELVESADPRSRKGRSDFPVKGLQTALFSQFAGSISVILAWISLPGKRSLSGRFGGLIRGAESHEKTCFRGVSEQVSWGGVRRMDMPAWAEFVLSAASSRRLCYPEGYYVRLRACLEQP